MADESDENILLTFEVGVDNLFPFLYEEEDGTGAKTPIDLSGHTATAQIRSTYGGTVLLDMSSMITMNAIGEITITVPAISATSNTLRNAGTKALWDLKIAGPGAALEKFAAGPVKIIQDVTRSV